MTDTSSATLYLIDHTIYGLVDCVVDQGRVVPYPEIHSIALPIDASHIVASFAKSLIAEPSKAMKGVPDWYTVDCYNQLAKSRGFRSFDAFLSRGKVVFVVREG